MIVRLARPSDADAIARIHVETWRDTYAGILPDAVLLRLSEGRERGGWTGAMLRGEKVFVAESDGGEVVGFGSCGPNRLRRVSADGEIYTLYVATDYQGRGHGGRLIRHMFDILRDAGDRTVVVWVLRDNPARFFYEAIGGRRMAERDERLWGSTVSQVAYMWTQPV